MEPEEVDKVVLSSFGPRFANLGPMEYLDFNGLDLIQSVLGYLYCDLDVTVGVPEIIKEKNEKDELGVKTGRGFYDWSKYDPSGIRNRRDREFLRRMKERKK